MSFRTEERIPEGLRINVVVGASCDGCDKELEMVGPEGSRLISDGLGIILSGGYGMFFDDRDVSATLCKECSMKLLETFPGLRKAMDLQATW